MNLFYGPIVFPPANIPNQFEGDQMDSGQFYSMLTTHHGQPFPSFCTVIVWAIQPAGAQGLSATLPCGASGLCSSGLSYVEPDFQAASLQDVLLKIWWPSGCRTSSVQHVVACRLLCGT